MNTDDLFISLDRLPKKPRCSTDPKAHGSWIRSRSGALCHQYIQLDPPGVRLWMAFDVDRPAGALAWQPEGLPQPAWSCTTRDNGHGHIVYGLSVPVVGSDLAERQVRYYEAVYEAFRARLGADAGYPRVLTKNPAHPSWLLDRGQRRLWALGELAEYIQLPPLKFRPGRAPEGGLGRNCDTFDRLRCWAYTRVDAARQVGSLDAWRAACDEKVQELDQLNVPPMGWSETKHISKSVAVWTWREYDGSSGAGGPNRLAQQLGRLGGRPGHGAPWIDLGISRRQWFEVRRLPPEQRQARMKKWTDHKNMIELHRFHSQTLITTTS
jgi:hypothetical protein